MNACEFAWSAVAVAALSAVPVRAETLRVPQQYPTIQAAVDAALVGDVIVIARGTYPGNVFIGAKAQLTLRAVGRVVLQATQPGPVVLVVESTGVLLQRLELTGATGAEGIGVRVIDSTQVSVSRCTSRENEDDGFQVWFCDEVLVDRCRSLHDGDEGVEVWNSTHVLVSRNNVIDPGHWGMDLESESTGSMLVKAERNRIQQAHDFGLYGWGVGLVIERNRIMASGQDGLYLEDGSFDVVRNVISKAGGDGVVLDKVVGTGLSRNRVQKAGGDGYDLTSSDGQFARNTSTKAGGCGFLVRTGGNTFLQNRALESVAWDLMDLGDGTNDYTSNVFKTVYPEGQLP